MDHQTLPNGERDLTPRPDRQASVEATQISRDTYRIEGRFLFGAGAIARAARERMDLHPDVVAQLVGELLAAAKLAEHGR